MNSLKDKIMAIRAELAQALQQATHEDALECVRITYMGRNGHIAQLMDSLKKLSLEEKRMFGPLLNDLKFFAESAYQERSKAIAHEHMCHESKKKQHFDVTAYLQDEATGSLHIYTHIINQIQDIFTSMGYELADGPEVETEYYNFDALNMPATHPARDMYDTIWISNVQNMLLRAHTSPVQVRAMETQGVPLAIFVPGRTYRHEATDATHDFMFSQVEGLFIDKNVSISNLIATAKAFLSALFEVKDLAIRVRPSYFPFVEPGLEIDFSCPFCTSGCSICKKSGFIEMMGAGLLHPHVLRCGGVDPEIYSGFAFGIGLERLAMIKYGINDIRLFHGNKLSFLEQF
jgi:phenylalanyl-tRNA synthetase, alpha subunit